MAAALAGVGYLCTSHDVCPEFREYERTSTTVINAYLARTMSGYLRGIHNRARSAWYSGPRPRSASTPLRVHVMQSNGGIISAEKAAQARATLSFRPSARG